MLMQTVQDRTRDAPVTKGEERWFDLIPALALLLVGAIGLVLATPIRGDSDLYAVVVPAWYGSARTFKLAASVRGEIVDISALSRNIIVIHSSRPDAVAALYHAGAWLVLRPSVLNGCIGGGSATNRLVR